MSGDRARQVIGSPERFFQDIAQAPSMESTGAPYVAHTTSVEVVCNVASVRVDETGFLGKFAFSNWLHLVRDGEGAWLIASKLFVGSPDPAGD